jgi:hypothetical protein
MPTDHGVGLDDDEGIGPARPDLGQTNPESAVGGAEARVRCRAAEYAELLAEGEILEGELGTGSESRAESGK